MIKGYISKQEKELTNARLELLFARYMEKEEKIKELPEIPELKDYYSSIEEYNVDVETRKKDKEERWNGLCKNFADVTYNGIDQKIKDIIPANINIGVKYKGSHYTICYFEDVVGDVIAFGSPSDKRLKENIG